MSGLKPEQRLFKDPDCGALVEPFVARDALNKSLNASAFTPSFLRLHHVVPAKAGTSVHSVLGSCLRRNDGSGTTGRDKHPGHGLIPSIPKTVVIGIAGEIAETCVAIGGLWPAADVVALAGGGLRGRVGRRVNATGCYDTDANTDSTADTDSQAHSDAHAHAGPAGPSGPGGNPDIGRGIPGLQPGASTRRESIGRRFGKPRTDVDPGRRHGPNPRPASHGPGY